MKVILASPRGFCAGVNMAIEALDKVLELCGSPVYVFHEIVHNRHVVERFKGCGAIFVDSLSEVPEGALLLYSAHGVSPEVRKEASARKLRAIDATCPLVTKVHQEAIKFAKEGYQILLIGHRGHDEVVGTMGEAPEAIRLIEDVIDVEKLDLAPDAKIAYLTQTTLSVDDANVIISALRNRYPQIVGPKRDDICYATQNRQQAIHVFAPESDVVLVLGSQNSSNSKRLAEIARLEGKEAYLIDGVNELNREWLANAKTVLITAGASAPESVVRECVDYLREHYGAEVESRMLTEESVYFALPKELKSLGHQPSSAI